ncbi:hypothetical protein M0805_004607 [Coniferiporia weirii]|nr:hypothetical protein M0805_004607 [Coniferiporia weirii]
MFALGRIALVGVVSAAFLLGLWGSGSDDNEGPDDGNKGKEAEPPISSDHPTESNEHGHYCHHCHHYHSSANYSCLDRPSLSQGARDHTSEDSHWHGTYGGYTLDWAATDSDADDDLHSLYHQDSLHIEQEDENDVLEPVAIELIRGETYRKMAGTEARLRNTAYRNSQQYFRSGKKAMAKQLSDEGKRYDKNVKRYNALAATEIFAYYNPGYSSISTSPPLVRCDLHGLHVEEALEYARDHLVRCHEIGLAKTMLIVGVGNHSRGGVAKIKPAVIQMLKNRHDLTANVHETNGGCIIVEFSKA